MSWLDANADITRRAWVRCPQCDAGRDCHTCISGRNCEHHWVYLLEAHGFDLWLQCPNCLHRWQHRTRPVYRSVEPWSTAS